MAGRTKAREINGTFNGRNGCFYGEISGEIGGFTGGLRGFRKDLER